MKLHATLPCLLLSLAPACALDERDVAEDLADADAPASRARAAEDQAQDERLHLRARVEVQPGELLEIDEPRPGLLIVTTSGAPAGAPRLSPAQLQGLPVRELWAAATGDAAVPPALAEALARSGDVAVEFGERDPAPAALAAPPSPASAGYCDSTWLTEGAAKCEDALIESDLTVCLDDWWNGAWAQTQDGYWTVSSVCAAQGSVVMELQSDDGPAGVWSVAQGTYRFAQVRDGACLTFFDDCPWVRVDIKQATGDRFHFRFVADEE